MGKYLVIWEIDQARVPISPQERGTAWGGLMDIVKEKLRKGVYKDWGVFVGENRGYTIQEGTEVEVSDDIQQYVPWITVKVYPIMSAEQVAKVIKALTK